MFNYVEPGTGNVKVFKLGAHLVIGIVLLIVILSNLPFTTVGGTEVGVVTKFGQIQSQPLSSGLHVISPFGTEVIKMSVQVQKDQVKASAASKDLQTVSTEVAVNYHLNSDRVIDIYRSFKNNIAETLVSPALQESVKAATAKYTAEELVTKRETVRDEMEQNVKDKMANTGVTVDGFNIIDLDFSPQFNQAIEAKVTAEQNALAAKNKLDQVNYESQQLVVQAKAEAEAIQLKSQAANNDKYIQLQQLEVQKEFASKWNGILPVNLYGSAPIPFLQVGGK
jgi:prohibitin 2